MKAAPTVFTQVSSKKAFHFICITLTVIFIVFLMVLFAYYSQISSEPPLIDNLDKLVRPNIHHEKPSEGSDTTSTSDEPSKSKPATITKPKQTERDPSSTLASSSTKVTSPVTKIANSTKLKVSSSTTASATKITSSPKLKASEDGSSPTTKLPSSSIPPARPLAAVDPKVWKFQPPTSVMATRPRGTIHPNSLNPKRTYNTEPPNLPQCHSEGDKVVSIYWESHSRLLKFFEADSSYSYFTTGIAKCSLPDGAQCKFQNNDKLADAVFRFVSHFVDPAGPLRYCQDQILIAFNPEALRGSGANYQQLDLADIRIDQFFTSDVYWKLVCFEFPNIYKGRPPVDPAKRTKAAALFLSDCTFQFRNNYIQQVMKYIQVDSFGQCFHNVQQTQSRFSGDRNEIVTQTLAPYRMMITFENLIQEDYITEKIWVAYSGGAIPVYLGTPDVYDWVPGNHTFIDPRNFAGPKELAEYMKRVAEDDDLYRYHTSNFDWDKTKRMMDKYCGKRSDFVCGMCRLAYEKKSHRIPWQ